MSVIATAQPSSTNNNNNDVAVQDPPKRVEIDNLVSEFQKRLGDNWDDYQIAVSLFLVGKLSRDELMQQIQKVLDNKVTRRMHNQLLVSTLANCFRTEPMDGISQSGFGNQSLKKRKMGNKSSQYELLKKDILSLSIRERKRIKSITRESGKKGMMNSILTLTRQEVVPNVPLVTSNPAESQANLAKTVVWAKDILDGFNAPLCTETFELPEKNLLRDRMLGIMREHGLTGIVNSKAVDVMYLGLQYHLKALLGNALDNVRLKEDNNNTTTTTTNNNNNNNNKAVNIKGTNKNNNNNKGNNNEITNENSRKRKKVTLTLEDMYDSLSIAPHLIEPYGPLNYISDVLLKNDDDYDVLVRKIQATKKGNEEANSIDKDMVICVSATDSSMTDGINTVKYVVPSKVTPISYLLKPKDNVNGTDEDEIGKGEEVNEIKNKSSIIKEEVNFNKNEAADKAGTNKSETDKKENDNIEKDTNKVECENKRNENQKAEDKEKEKQNGEAKDKSKEKENTDKTTENERRFIPPPNLALSDPSIGTPDELAWLINDLLAEGG